ncbi:MAG: ABC transporter ATP-binding protein [bacterium]
MIEARELRKSYGQKEVLKGISFRVDPGEIFGVLGPNGAGKTTTLRILTGMIKPGGGDAVVAGFDVAAHPQEVKRRIGVVPETGALYEHLTPREFLTFCGDLFEVEENTLGARIEKLLQVFNLARSVDEKMTTFSKGMKQKVVIVAALIHDPEILFFDEVLNGLDVHAALLLKSIIRDLAARGKTVFFSSHILEVVERMCDRVAIMDHGQIVAQGHVADLMRLSKQTTLEGVFRGLTVGTDYEREVKAFVEALG